MEDSEEDEFLSLSLSVAAAGRSERKKNKAKKRDIINNNNNNANSIIISNSSPMRTKNHHSSSSPPSSSFYEAKIFRLLQMREMMLRQENHNNHNSNNRIRNKASDENNNNNNKGLPLIHLLLTTATAVEERNRGAALENLTELYRTVSLTGESVERVVAYFSDGLTARLLTRNSPFYEMLMEDDDEEHFLAFTDLYRVSPYYQFAHFTANQAILEAFEQEEHRNNRALHVVDFDVSYGFQWPSLIQSLSDKATGSSTRISLKVTGFGNSMKELQETESRLVSFSKGFNNLVFEFQGLLRSSIATMENGNNSSRIINMMRKNKKKNETVAVNLVCSYLRRSNSNSNTSVMNNNTLGFVHSLNPSIVVIVKQEGNSTSRSSVRTFLSRFTESLHYFAAMFDSLDDCLPLDSTERLRIEKKLLGREIKGLMNCDVDGVDYCNKYVYERMESHGFVGTKMSSKSLIQAKLLLKMRTHYCPLRFEQEGGFRVCERDQGRAISLAWQNSFLLTVSAWQPL